MKYGQQALRVLVLTGAFALSALSPVRANTIWYVNKNSTGGTQNGLSWTNAFLTVYAAIAAASPTVDAQGHSDEVWVAEGSYVPQASGGASNGFTIIHPLGLYGGFKSGDTSISGRTGSYILTILDGQFTTGSFAAHGVDITGVPGASGNMGVVIDGFLIKHGHAAAAGVNGGGISSITSDILLANLFVRDSSASNGAGLGGGLFFSSKNGSNYPTTGNILHMKNCEFSNCDAAFGGGIYGDDLQGEIVNTRILTNTAGTGGGAVLNHMGSSNRLDFTNSVFWENIATSTPTGGGGLYLDSVGNAQLVNCTFNGNQAIGSTGNVDGQALFVNTGSTATVYNTIFWGNSSSGKPLGGSGTLTMTYSDIEGWTGGGTGNIVLDPKFAFPGFGVLTLLSSSNCLDRADYSAVPLDDLDVDNDGITNVVLPIDLGGNARLTDQTTVTDHGVGGHNCPLCQYLDMGAYERP